MSRIFTFLYALTGVLGILVLVPSSPVEAQARNFTLTPDTLVEAEDDEDIEQWDDETINLTTNDPGVLFIESTGADLEGRSGSEDKCGGTRDVGAGWLPLTKGARSIHLRPGDYSLEILPHGSTWVKQRTRFRLRTYCGSSSDDHGDNKLCSTEICFSSTATDGEIDDLTSGEDEDFFSFVVTANSTSVTIESTGSTDIEAELYDEDGKRLASDDDGGSGTNFKIVETLDVGRYFFRIRGVNSALGTYAVTVQ